MTGLRRGTVAICEHQPEWEQSASECIAELKAIFGDRAVDIQHIGSTAIPHIKAKPIIDIAVGVESFDLGGLLPRLEAGGRYTKSHNRFSSDLLYVVERDGVRTHQIHILLYGCEQWHNYVDFRDYMNAHPSRAEEYEALKSRLVDECENVQTRYTDGKHEWMETALSEARRWAASR